MRYTYLLFAVMLIWGCAEEKTAPYTLFQLKDASIGIDFNNELSYTEDFNPYVYRNFYNGGGVAVGDINNDGLNDIYFTGNLVENKLYLNKGNWQFEDITTSSNTACSNVWSTGATFVDINADGYLDLYVCKSGKPGGSNRHNELFINNGDLTFTEKSKEYGLDIEGLSVQAAFFDYDRDGDLDCYLLNNSIKSIGAFDLVKDQRYIPDPSGSGNKFLKNEDGKFVDITEEAGIYSSAIGFGLGITLGDFNEDHWPDIFISNDFFERDYLYINNQKGAFTEELESYFTSISMGSMGADFADLDNDLRSDLIVTEMLPQTEERQKTKTVFETWDKQQVAKKQGYFNQFSRNTLQRNLGNGFVDLGRQTDVAATEWSWSALFFDANNDGLRDVFISNGIYKDLLDRDYLTYEANDQLIRERINSDEKEVIKKLIDAMPSKPVPNAAYQNQGDFDFEYVSESWGLDQPSFSNGSVYTDLDNDGDLDLVVNNVNMPSYIYENTLDTLNHRSITLRLSQKGKNTNAIGSKVFIKYGDGSTAFAENYNCRGFQSSIATDMFFGLDNHTKVDSLFIKWPDGTTHVLTDLATNTIHKISKEDKYLKEADAELPQTYENSIFEPVRPLFPYTHKENSYIDFNRERLLVQMYSNEGPAYASADLNEDGKPDFFVGGAKYQTGGLFISSKNGYQTITEPFEGDKNTEDTDAVFFDADGDGDQDLYVCHGGKAFSEYSADLHDSYYENVDGRFKKAEAQPVFPKAISTSTVTASDFDNDGDIDLFVGERFRTNIYGLPVSGYLLVNDGKGIFEVNQPQNMMDIGMITDAHWGDLNQDGWEDLVLVGEWMSVKIFLNENGILSNKTDDYNLQNSKGLWTSLKLEDIDSDGDLDIIAGNLGTNTFFEPEMRMFIADFDGNGFQEQLICKKKDNRYYPIIDKDELISQIPSLKKKLVYYEDYAKASISDIFDKQSLDNAYSSDLYLLKSTVFINDGKSFNSKPLPNPIQAAPVYAIESSDINNDGHIDLIFGGNQFLVKPKFGSYDGSRGWVIFGPDFFDSKAFPLNIHGQIRALDWLSENTLVVIKNDDEAVFYKRNE